MSITVTENQKNEICSDCDHDLVLHGEQGCAVMIDNNESCPCGGNSNG